MASKSVVVDVKVDERRRWTDLAAGAAEAVWKPIAGADGRCAVVPCENPLALGGNGFLVTYRTQDGRYSHQWAGGNTWRDLNVVIYRTDLVPDASGELVRTKVATTLFEVTAHQAARALGLAIPPAPPAAS